MNPLIFGVLLAPPCGGYTCEPPANLFSTWGFIGDHWVYKIGGGEKPSGSSNCPEGDMIEIKGGMVQNLDANPYGEGAVEYLQKRTCTKWINKNFPERCAEFDQANWEWMRNSIVNAVPRKNMHFCIDPYEWPNRIGEAPWIMVTWHEAQDLCESKGKRLCTENEWTFACEGEDALPYPYGYKRDSIKCNIDRPWKLYDAAAMLPRGTEKCGKEMERLWQGHASGEDAQCVSPFGVHDMTGNIDEWTVASSPSKYPSILKGGFWGPVRPRCRPSTRNHRPDHTFYQQGFRCCADVKQ
jgi:formylglycine-generating enzyme required for sulfatase activity